MDVEDWRLERFSPTGGQVGGAAALMLAGFAATMVIARVGGQDEDEDAR